MSALSRQFLSFCSANSRRAPPRSAELPALVIEQYRAIMGSFGVDRGAQVTGVACASLALPWLAVALRAYVRIGIQKFFGPEDYLTVASVVGHQPNLCIHKLTHPGYFHSPVWCNSVLSSVRTWCAHLQYQ